MATMNKHYKKGDLTVFWKPDQCIHSKKCWTGLVDVFDPRKRPWVNMDGAEEARIIEQVRQCPSGALSYMLEQKIANEQGETDVAVSVEVMKNGPLLVYGQLNVKDAQGNETQKNKVTAFCRCGASANKPYCDGSHMRVGFKDE